MIDMQKHGLTELPPMEEIERMLDKSKGRLFLKKRAAFLGTIMCSLEFIWDESVETAATDGIRFWWNPWFFCAIPEEERAFVIAHEIWHVAYDHVGRRLNREPRKWNIAGDHVINLDLISQGYSVKNLGFDIYADKQYIGMSTDEIYALLPPEPPSAGGGTGSQPGKGLGNDVRDCPAGQETKVVGTIVRAIQAAEMAKEAGSIPGVIREMVDKFLNPKLPWEVILQNFFNEISNEDYSYKRPNRRYEDPIMPTLHGNDALEHLAWYMDVSGSITEKQEQRIASEIKFIKENFNPKQLDIIQFDTKIQKVDTYYEDDEFTKIEVVGRGGTCLEPVRKHIEQTKPTAAVIFSDMYVSPMSSNPGIPIIWIVVDNSSANIPFGTKHHVSD